MISVELLYTVKVINSIDGEVLVLSGDVQQDVWDAAKQLNYMANRWGLSDEDIYSANDKYNVSIKSNRRGL